MSWCFLLCGLYCGKVTSKIVSSAKGDGLHNVKSRLLMGVGQVISPNIAAFLLNVIFQCNDLTRRDGGNSACQELGRTGFLV